MTEKDPRIEMNRKAMEFIWQQVPKEVKEGIQYVTYVKTDLPYLYYSGTILSLDSNVDLPHVNFGLLCCNLLSNFILDLLSSL